MFHLLYAVDADSVSHSQAEVTPWEVKGAVDYDKLIREFGTPLASARHWNGHSDTPL